MGPGLDEKVSCLMLKHRDLAAPRENSPAPWHRAYADGSLQFPARPLVLACFHARACWLLFAHPLRGFCEWQEWTGFSKVWHTGVIGLMRVGLAFVESLLLLSLLDNRILFIPLKSTLVLGLGTSRVG